MKSKIFFPRCSNIQYTWLHQWFLTWGKFNPGVFTVPWQGVNIPFVNLVFTVRLTRVTEAASITRVWALNHLSANCGIPHCSVLSSTLILFVCFHFCARDSTLLFSCHSGHRPFLWRTWRASYPTNLVIFYPIWRLHLLCSPTALISSNPRTLSSCLSHRNEICMSLSYSSKTLLQSQYTINILV